MVNFMIEKENKTERIRTEKDKERDEKKREKNIVFV
jgi:hypothetical protein